MTRRALLPWRQLARYGTVSVISAGITLGVPMLLHEGLGVEARLAVAIALSVAFVVNFLAFQGWVFGTRGAAGRSFVRFLVVSLAFRGAEYLAFLLLFTIAKLPYMVALVGILLLSFCLKFVTYQRLVFASDARPSAR
jgi:putative flippase GtrA